MTIDLSLESTSLPAIVATKKPIRVLYICHDGGLYGAEQSLLQLVQQLDPLLVQPFVSIARPGPLAQTMVTIPGVTVLSHKRVSWVKHANRQWYQRIGDIASLFFNACLRVPALVSTINQYGIDVVHTNSVVSLEGALAAAWCRITGRGVDHVWHIRELFTYPNPRFQPVLGITAMRYGIPLLSTRLVGISQAVIDQFPPRCCLAKPREQSRRSVISDPNAVKIIPNPVSVLAFGEVTPTVVAKTVPYTFRLGFVGRLSPGKGLLTVLQAMSSLKLVGNQRVELHLYGQFVDSSAEFDIQEAILADGLSDNVIFHGFTPSSDIYDNLDALVLPSLNEAFGRVLVEAMAQGVLCFGANAGAIPELVRPNKTGWLFEADSPSDLAKTVELMLAQWRLDPISVQTIRSQAQAFVTELCNPHLHAQLVMALYQAMRDDRQVAL